MDDLTMLEAVGATLDPTTDGPPPTLRHRVVAGFREPVPRRYRFWGLGWGLATAGGLTAALAIVLIIGSAGPSGKAPGEQLTNASDILLRAAQTARTDTAPVPRPDQFVFVESISSGQGSEVAPGGQQHFFPIHTKLRQDWLSVDGTRDGLFREGAAPGHPPPARDIIAQMPMPGCRKGRAAAIGKDGKVIPGKFDPCVPRPAYRPDLPIDADAMLRYLRDARGRDTDKALFEVIKDLIQQGYMTPAQRAALFEATSRLSSVVVVPDVTDITGRAGIAVALTLLYPNPSESHAGASTGPSRPVAQLQLIFDPARYSYLGYREVVTADVGHYKAGTVLSQSAVLQTGIVDQAGQRP